MNKEIQSKIREDLRDLLVSAYPKGITLIIKYEPGRELSIEEKARRYRNKTVKFRVCYGENDYSCNGEYERGVRVLRDVIKRVGAARVMDMNIMTSGKLNLIQVGNETILGKKPVAIGEGYWFISQTSNAEKQNQIRRIIENLGNDWMLELDN